MADDDRIEVRPVRYTLEESVLGSIEALPGASPDLEHETEDATAEQAERIVRRLERP